MPRRLITAAIALLITVVLASPATAGLETSKDQQIADESVLTSSDVPSGFEQVPPDDDDTTPASKVCRTVRRGRDALDDAPNAEVEFRTRGDASGSALIGNKVAVFETTKAATRALRAYADDDTGRCFEQNYRKIFESELAGADGASVEVTSSRYAPDGGDAAVGYEVEIEASAEGDSQTFYVDLAVYRVGRTIDAFAYFNSGSQPPSDDVAAMTDAGLGRLEDAL